MLAVGDAEFQRKCLGKMRDVASDGRTVVFVSHNLGAIQRLCERALLLEGGRLVADGSPSDVVARYMSAGAAGPVVGRARRCRRRRRGWAPARRGCAACG